MESIRDELVRVARDREITYYSDVGPLEGLDMGTEIGRIRIAQTLGEISTAECAAGRPMLSSVVVLKETKYPGRGFFDLAQSLGLYDGTDELEYWVRELQRTQDYWAENA